MTSSNMIMRESDLANRFSGRTTSAFTAKTLFEEHVPYMREYSDTGDLSIFINRHFLIETRRQLSGVVTLADSQFSVYEQPLWDNYIEWVNGTDFEGELLQAIETLDFWLTEELQAHVHDTVERSYSTTHKWMKMTKREEA